MAVLRPLPLAALVRRMFRELETADAVFDLPTRKFFPGAPGVDLGVVFHGRRAASPLGPAAGPHTQMAQNLVLSWLGGSRILELKTVQIQDELHLPRPCIDMRTVGFNAEWSQELKLEQSLEEYVKGAMLVEMLRASGRVPVAPEFTDTVYDMSVGYDLAGIRSPRVQAFIQGLMDARSTVERLRGEIPAVYRRYRDLDFPTRLSGTLTLSTFHGCPPEEIERILDFLMKTCGLHCVVKFNPTLLGPEDVRRLLGEVMGYGHLRIPDTAFTRDTTWAQAVDMVERLEKTARSLGLGFGVKFSNTLIVENDASFLPASEKEVYLSGPPLHVLAMNLVARFRRHFGDRLPISFAAGVDRTNFPDLVALGLVPITVCSDLLQPGGYGRLEGYSRELVRRMTAAGAGGVGDFALRAFGGGEAAWARAGFDPRSEAGGRAQAALLAREPLEPAVGSSSYAAWVSAAHLLNTERYAAAATADPRYALVQNAKSPKKIGRRLKLFDCLSCDKCIPVCPNDAIFTFRIGRAEIPVVKLRREGQGWSRREEDPLSLTEDHQIAVFADFCNECGNCDVFCPEDGGPYTLKPRFFGSEAAWRAAAEAEGFYVERGEQQDLVLGRFTHGEYRLEATRRESGASRGVFSGPGFSVKLDDGGDEVRHAEPGVKEIDLTYAFLLREVAAAVLDPARMNPVNSLADESA